MTSILIWQKNATERAELCSLLEEKGYQAILASNQENALSQFSEQTIHLVIMDLDFAGLEILRNEHPLVPILVVAHSESSSEAIRIVQAGAFDFLPRPFEQTELLALISQVTASLGEKEHHPLPTYPVKKGELVGNSRAMGKLYRDIAKLAATPVSVLIRGETGAGKELVAQALWRHGHRAHYPLTVVNCAAIPENLLESELFGYEKGAFTGATTSRKGKFEQANGATLFLDEIGDMSLPLQAKMLRVLQEKRIEPIGSKGEISVDVRLIAATHQPLEKMVEEGLFREDLLYRLQATSITLPPLRDRMGDVEILSSHFLSDFNKELNLEGKISKEAISFLARQSWPGNVRQLQNVLRRALLKRRNLVIGRDDLVDLFNEKKSTQEQDNNLIEMATIALENAEQAGQGNVLRELISQFEKTIIQEALERSGGNQSKTARWLGITRLTLREKLKN